MDGGDSSSGNNSNQTYVRLLIKASNQQYEDLYLDGELSWTVKGLKTHLSNVYPNKPPVADQKLIYSGQLLNDSLELKDVIRIYKDVYTQHHIIHLVYTPKSSLGPLRSKKLPTTVPPTMHTTTNTDGLRRRTNGTTNDSVEQQQQQQQQNQPQILQSQQYQQQQFYANMMNTQQQMLNGNILMNAATTNCPPPPPPYDINNTPNNVFPYAAQNFATQQAVMYNWMHQVYSQYMDQYLRMTDQLGTTNATTAAAAANNIPNGGFFIPPTNQQMPFLAANIAASNAAIAAQVAANAAAAASTNPVISFTNGATTITAQPAVAATAPVDQVAEQQQQQQQQQQRPAGALPRFPHIVQEAEDNRDWLDGFFSLTRLAIFLTILYFNSSPLRCLMVILIGGTIYLYHTGILRIRRERNNNNINRNNNAAAEQIRHGVQQVQDAQAAEQRQQHAVNGDGLIPAADAADAVDTNNSARHSNDDATNAATDAAIVNAEENNNSVISFIRTFVVTFFTSLLPETGTL